MSQHDRLRERTEQHKPKNLKSKIDDKESLSGHGTCETISQK